MRWDHPNVTSHFDRDRREHIQKTPVYEVRTCFWVYKQNGGSAYFGYELAIDEGI